MSVKKGSAVDAALLHFKQVDPILYVAALPHAEYLQTKTARKRKTGNTLFAELASSVTGQQLSTKAADTIWSRLVLACKGEVTPEAIKRLRMPTLRKAGLSAAKARTLKELSEATLSRKLNLLNLKKINEEQAIAELSSVWGIGRWTAEMFLMFALYREDVFSVGDLGLRRSMETLYVLEKDVHQNQLEDISKRWSPHRTVASRVLWRIRDSK
ncbi:DNA-3-methyladenine glycosylase 2 family protein [Patescibacteria group bacterium]|nr:DNA-3-methyladenine glycosylase 2 family protein [Patescibacteria group bacterium]